MIMSIYSIANRKLTFEFTIQRSIFAQRRRNDGPVLEDTIHFFANNSEEYRMNA
jgi:hypothetical protein